jgi:hypothetical protein
MIWSRISSLPTISQPKAALLCAATMLVSIHGWHWHISIRIAGTAEITKRLQSSLSSAREGTADQSADYVQRLPEQLSIDPVVSQLQRSSAQLGVTFVSVALTSQNPTTQTLGRTELSVILRGNYPNIKIVLSEALERFPQLAMQRMVLRRLASPNDLEARLELVQVTRSLTVAAAGR